jgi:hypothetical protein
LETIVTNQVSTLEEINRSLNAEDDSVENRFSSRLVFNILGIKYSLKHITTLFSDSRIVGYSAQYSCSWSTKFFDRTHHLCIEGRKSTSKFSPPRKPRFSHTFT